MISFSDIAKFFEEIEMRLVASLKRNLSRHKQEEKDEGFEWSAWQAEKLRSVDRFRKENADIVGEYTEVIDKDTRELMQEQFREGEKLAEETIEKTLGTDAPKKLSTEPVPQFFGVDSNKVDSLIQDITTLEKNVETAALRMTDDVYRQTLHRTQLALSTGSMTLEQAIDISVKDFLDKGINCIVYKDGRRVNIADYVRMALRTTETRAKLQGMSKRARELGYDTVLVSQYSMCSDTCLPWQGRVYIEDMFVLWDGEVEERDNGELWGKSHYCGKWFPLLSTAVHKGLFHPNCRHSITVWIEGVSVLPAKLDGAEVKKKSALEQQQRRLENEVRKAKRLVEGALDPDNVRENKRKLRDAQKKLKEFIDEHPDTLRRDYKREKIYTADEPKRPKVENITLKSYGNAEKTVDKSGGNDIIKKNTLETAEKEVHNVGIIDVDKYKNVTDKKILTDEVIITDNRIEHIIERRGQQFYDEFHDYFAEIIKDPDYIFKDEKVDTAVVSKTFVHKGKTVNIVLRLVVEGDDPNYKNSIITAIGENEKRFAQRLRNNTPVYRKLDKTE